jgi:hypothetical protein
MPIRYKLVVNATVYGCIALTIIGHGLFQQAQTTLDDHPHFIHGKP